MWGNKKESRGVLDSAGRHLNDQRRLNFETGSILGFAEVEMPGSGEVNCIDTAGETGLVVLLLDKLLVNMSQPIDPLTFYHNIERRCSI